MLTKAAMTLLAVIALTSSSIAQTSKSSARPTYQQAPVSVAELRRRGAVASAERAIATRSNLRSGRIHQTASQTGIALHVVRTTGDIRWLDQLEGGPQWTRNIASQSLRA